VYLTRNWDVSRIGRAFSGVTPEGNNTYVGHHYLVGMDSMYDGSFIGPANPITTAWRLYSADSAAGAFRLFSNGVLLGTGSGGVGLNGYWAFSGTSLTTGSETGHYDLPELILYNRKLSDAERAQVEGYMRTKWVVV
jgi:hypothetical protein